MSKYSILMRISRPDQPRLEAAIASVVAQTFPDWELVLVGTAAELDRLGPQDPRVRLEVAAAEEPLSWTINRLAGLGDWIGFLGQDDFLQPETLGQVELGLADQSWARVVYTDEESCNRHGQLSLRSRKGAVNPLRLRSQEYLRDFVAIHRPTLQELGGFHRLANTCPTHDLFLRIQEAHGAGAFLYLPQRLYQRYRDHREPLPTDRYDLWAVEQHLARLQLPATVRHLNGGLDITYQLESRPWVTVIVVVTDDIETGLRRIHRSQIGPQYRPVTFKVLHLGSNPTARLEYEAYCSALHLSYEQSGLALVAALNHQARRTDTELLMFLQGEPVSVRWLHRMVDHMQPGVGAVGARCWTGTRLHQPGILGYAYEGWDWNTAGRFNVLTVPHHIAAVTPACLLIDTRRFLQLDGFSTLYPTLYGMDLCLRLDEAGFSNVMVPMSQVEVSETVIPVAEADDFRVAWSGWQDRYGLHL